MNGIYLTEKGKQEIEAEIAELETTRKESSSDNNDYYLGRIEELEEILYSATILPVEESWEHGSKFTNVKYKHGVIIHSKQ